MPDSKLKISDVGEKSFIRDFIKPFFNADNDPYGVGDDCAMVRVGDDVVLFSSDRVPADLTAFRLGILDHSGLGDYLARLNLSDIAACGGRPVALLLNLGLPANLAYENAQAICQGFQRQALKANCRVLGGDMTDAVELSISATSVGVAKPNEVLTRRGAKAGDSIFLTRPAGLTPAAFEYFLGNQKLALTETDVTHLREQFTAMTPMIDLGRKLATSGVCTSCMDNTDGIGQSLTELSEASGVSFVIEETQMTIPELVLRVATQAKRDPLQFLFNGGADFSLIGTLQGKWTRDLAKCKFGDSLEIIGHVEAGAGVKIVKNGVAEDLTFKGWNYFL